MKPLHAIRENGIYCHACVEPAFTACETQIEVGRNVPYRLIPCECGEVVYVWRAASDILWWW